MFNQMICAKNPIFSKFAKLYKNVNMIRILKFTKMRHAQTKRGPYYKIYDMELKGKMA